MKPTSKTELKVVTRITQSEFRQRYLIREKIGNGSFGLVYRIKEIKSGKYYALKKIQVRHNESVEQFLREIQIQSHLAHSLVVEIFEFFIISAHQQYYSHKTQVCLIMELGQRTLFDVIQKTNFYFPLEEIIKFAYDFICLFAAFQESSIVHRDIKPQNFIHFSTDKLSCKLSDFGSCCHVQDIRNIGGSFNYLSPQLKSNYLLKNRNYKTNPFKDDVYSFGLTIYQLAIKKIRPQRKDYRDKDILGAYNDVYRATHSQQLSGIIEVMLKHNENERPDFLQLKNFFQTKFGLQSFDQNSKTQKNLSKLSSESLKQPVSQIQGQIYCSDSKIQHKNQPQEISLDYESIPKGKQLQTNLPQNRYQNQKLSYIYSKQQTYSSPTCKSTYLQTPKPAEDTEKTYKPPIQDDIFHEPNEQLIDYCFSIKLDGNIKITSIIKMKQFLIIGCMDGSLYSMNLELNVQERKLWKLRGMNCTHQNDGISILKKDQYGQMWSCSRTGGKLLLWKRLQLMQSLMRSTHYKVEESLNKTIFGQIIKKIHYFVDIKPDANEELQLPIVNKSGITTLECISQTNFAVGYADGHVYAKFDNGQIYYQVHKQPITVLKFFQNRLFTGSLDGLIKSFDLKNGTLNGKLTMCHSPIVGLNIRGTSSQPIFRIMTINGTEIILNKFNCFQMQEKQHFSRYADNKIVLGTNFIDNMVISLSTDGNLLINGKEIKYLGTLGWNCMTWDGRQTILMGSYQGKIQILRLKLEQNFLKKK